MRSKKSIGYSEEDFERDFGGQLSEDYDYEADSVVPGRAASRSTGAGRSKSELKRDRKERKAAKKRREKARKSEDRSSAPKGAGTKKQNGRRQGSVGGRNSRKKTALIIVIGVLVLVAAIGAIGYGYMINKLDKVNHYSLKGEDLDIDSQVAKDLKDYENVLLLGIDSREGEDIESCRSDAIIIASINKKNGDIKLISVYRDSYLDLEENGYHVFDKVTHAHAYAGPVNTIRSLNRNMDLNIESFVRVDWKTVADFADAMGGLTLNVKDYEISELNKYIYDTNESLHGDTSLITHAGKQKLNGVQTVTYCRIRKGTSGGDTFRAKRMRNAINASFEKAKKMKITELDAVANKILPEITTSMDSADIMARVFKLATYEIKGNIGWPFEYSGAMINGVSYDVPVNLEANVKKLHKKAFGQKGYKVTDRVKALSDEIISLTGIGATY